MEKLTFKRRLIDFFKRHDRTNMHLIDPIVEQFAGKEEVAFEVLNKFYTGKKSGVERELLSTELTLDTSFMGPHVGSAVSSTTM